MKTIGMFLGLVVGLMSLADVATAQTGGKPHFGFELKGHGVELTLIKQIPNTVKNPRHTRIYSATVKKGSTFTLDVGEYLQGGSLPEPRRVEIAAPVGQWQHDESVNAKPTTLEGEKFSQPGPTTMFTATTSGKSTLVFELDDRPNAKRKIVMMPTNVVWRFEVELKVEAGEDRSYVMVTEGIVGGFVPAHVRRRIVIVSCGEELAMLVMKQPARNVEATYHKAALSKMEYLALLKKLADQGLWNLPVEVPAGCQDIYKMDTSITVSANQQFWRNGGPAGCAHGTSKVQPGKEDQEKFRQIVTLLTEFADKHAKANGDAKSFQEAVSVISRDGTPRSKD